MECSYTDCGAKGRYQRVTVDTRAGVIIRKQSELFCPDHWWNIEEKK